jgi:hypothetical protein
MLIKARRSRKLPRKKLTGITKFFKGHFIFKLSAVDLQKRSFKESAGGGIRTLAPVKTLVFETSAYTSSATPALKG